MLEWKELFIPTILERGKGLLPSDISNVSISKEGLIAKIQGTEKYELQIHTGLDWITCSCPFAQNNGLACKHMAALLIYCENNWTSEMEEFFKNSETSPMGQQATRCKIERLEKEQRAFKRYQEWLQTEPQRQAERAERARLAEERKKESERKAEEKRKKQEERERKRQEKLKIVEEKRIKQERVEEERRRQEIRKAREEEELKRIFANGEERKRREREWNHVKKERNWGTAEYCDEENISRLKAFQLLGSKTKKEVVIGYIKEKLGEDVKIDNELIEYMTEELIEELMNKDDMMRLKKTGWYYSE